MSVTHDEADTTPEDCDRCTLPWTSCICDPALPNRQPTPDEIARARAGLDHDETPVEPEKVPA